MRSLRFPILLFLLILVLSTGCLSRNPKVPIHLYTLEESRVVPETRIILPPLSLGVYGFDTSPSIEARILYRISAVELGYYDYDRWGEPPGEMVTRAFMRGLSASHLFSGILRGEKYPQSSFDWILTGTLERFEEDHTTEPAAAHIRVNLEIYRADSYTRIWKRSLEAREALEGDSAENLVLAMNKALGRILIEAKAEMERILTEKN
jgi:ABC-type uncharacterized transport system auxiliary subunit